MEKKQAHLGLTAYNQNDVLKGKGIIINNSPGNVQYRSIVNAWKRRYVYANRESKPWYSEQIYKQIQDMNPPGRFLKYDESSARWCIIPKKDALRKIRQALRENARGIMQEPPPQQDVKEDHLLRVEEENGTVSSRIEEPMPRLGFSLRDSNKSSNTEATAVLSSTSSSVADLHFLENLITEVTPVLNTSVSCAEDANQSLAKLRHSTTSTPSVTSNNDQLPFSEETLFNGLPHDVHYCTDSILGDHEHEPHEKILHDELLSRRTIVPYNVTFGKDEEDYVMEEEDPTPL